MRRPCPWSLTMACACPGVLLRSLHVLDVADMSCTSSCMSLGATRGAHCSSGIYRNHEKKARPPATCICPSNHLLCCARRLGELSGGFGGIADALWPVELSAQSSLETGRACSARWARPLFEARTKLHPAQEVTRFAVHAGWESSARASARAQTRCGLSSSACGTRTPLGHAGSAR